MSTWFILATLISWNFLEIFLILNFLSMFFGTQGGHFSGIYRKVQLKPLKWVKVPKANGEGEEERPTEALMVLKYGGVLTHAGRKQVMIYCFMPVDLNLPIIQFVVSVVMRQ